MSDTKKHTPASTRKAIVATLNEQIEQNGGTPPPGLIRLTARHLNVSRWTVYRWLGMDPKERANRAQRQLTQDELIAIALNGSISGAYDDLHERGEFPGSLTKLYRIANATPPALFQGALHGVDGVRSNIVSVIQPRPQPLELVSLDHLKNPFLITGEGGHPMNVWLTIILEHGSKWKLPVPTFCSVADGDANAVAETVVAGLTRFLSGIVASDGTVVGGIFQTLLVDNGLENSANSILAALATLGITFDHTPFYTPHLNGQSERTNGTYKRRMAFQQPGYDDKDAPKLRFGGKLAPRGRLLTWSEFLDRLIEFFRKENEEVKRDCLDGRTSLQTWKDEAPTAVLVPRERSRHLFLAEANRFPKVTNKGVEYDTHFFAAPELNRCFGQRVALRVLPNTRDFVDVYDRRTGQFICEAINQKLIDAEHAQELARVRTETHKEVDYVLKAAAASLWLPDQGEAPARGKRAASTTAGLRDTRQPKVAERKAAARDYLANIPDPKEASA